MTRNAATYWRSKAKAGDGQVYGRIINTSSEAGLSGPVGQPNYVAAKAGITALTLSAARALERFVVRVNAIAPRAGTAMTAGVFGSSPAAVGVNGQLFIVYGPTVTLIAAPTAERQFSADGDAWDPPALSDTLQGYFADRDPELSFSAAMGLRDRD